MMDSVYSLKQLDFLRTHLEVKSVRFQHVVELIQDFEIVPPKARARFLHNAYQKTVFRTNTKILEQVQSEKSLINLISEISASDGLTRSGEEPEDRSLLNDLNTIFRQEKSPIYEFIRIVYKNLTMYSGNAAKHFSIAASAGPARQASFQVSHFYEYDANAKRRFETGQLDDVIKETDDGSAYQIGVKYSYVSKIAQFKNLVNIEIIKINGLVNMARIYRDEVRLLLQDLSNNSQAMMMIQNNKKRQELYKSLSDYISLTFIFILDYYVERERLLTTVNKLETCALDILEENLEAASRVFQEAESIFQHNAFIRIDIQRPKTFREHLRNPPKRLHPNGIDLIVPEVCSTDLENEFDIVLSNQVLLTIVGRRGAGKSSFINSIRNLRSFDEGAARVRETECTMRFEFYPFETTKLKGEGDSPEQPGVAIAETDNSTSLTNSNSSMPENDAKASSMSTEDRVYLCDLPGVGTENFPNMNYEMLEADLFIYVFYPSLDEIDYKVIKSIEESSAKSKLILVRNKVDMDLQDLVEHVEFDDIDDEEQLRKLVDGVWPSMQGKLGARILRGDTELSRFFEPERRFYFLSSNYSYRKLFDFERLLYDMLDKYISSESKRNALEQNIAKKFGTKYLMDQLKNTYSLLKHLLGN